MKDRVLALLSHHGNFDPEEGGVSSLKSLAKRLKDERDAAETARLAASAAEAARLEARSRENARQEGALGALPRAYGVDAPRVAGAAEAHLQQNHKTTTLVLLLCLPVLLLRPLLLSLLPLPTCGPMEMRPLPSSSSKRPLLNYLLSKILLRWKYLLLPAAATAAAAVYLQFLGRWGQQTIGGEPWLFNNNALLRMLRRQVW